MEPVHPGNDRWEPWGPEQMVPDRPEERAYSQVQALGLGPRLSPPPSCSPFLPGPEGISHSSVRASSGFLAMGVEIHVSAVPLLSSVARGASLSPSESVS